MIIRCWDTRVQSYPISASKIKSINCSAWPFLYFLFTADDWNFCDTFLSPWTKSTFLFVKILIRYWGTGVQSYLISACKIFGVARKRRVPAEKCSYRSTKKLMCLKQKDWSKRGVPATSTRCPDHLSRQFLTTASTFPYNSKNSSAEHIHSFIHVSVFVSLCVCLCVCASEWVSVWVCVCLFEWVCL